MSGREAIREVDKRFEIRKPPVVGCMAYLHRRYCKTGSHFRFLPRFFLNLKRCRGQTFEFYVSKAVLVYRFESVNPSNIVRTASVFTCPMFLVGCPMFSQDPTFRNGTEYVVRMEMEHDPYMNGLLRG